MKANSKPSSFEEQLNELLSLFDNGNNKEDLARRLVKIFQLHKDGDYYPYQIEKILKRKLTESEVFKLSILDRVLNRYSGGGAMDGNG